MPDHHAILSPSSAHRWISCPASIRLEALIPVPKESSEGSSYAAEGTLAHSLGELKARLRFGMVDSATYSFEELVLMTECYDRGWDWEEMQRHTDDYVELIADRMTLFPHSTLRLERRVHPQVPECWGTADVIIISPQHVEIIDLKYGTGIRVDAEGNPQLRLYGVGALELADLLGDIKLVRCTVFQPRRDSVSTEELTAEELRHWRDSIIPIAEDALSGSDVFGPSQEACRFCPAAGDCKARMEAAAAEDFATDPDLLTPEEVGDLLTRLPEVRAWLSDFETAAMRRMYDERQHIPGWKVVYSGGRRSVVDPEAARKALLAAGYTEDMYLKPPAERALKTLGDLEKLCGRDSFRELLEEPGYVAKPLGSPTIVPEADPRPVIDPNAAAAADFQEEPE